MRRKHKFLQVFHTVGIKIFDSNTQFINICYHEEDISGPIENIRLSKRIDLSKKNSPFFYLDSSVRAARLSTTYLPTISCRYILYFNRMYEYWLHLSINNCKFLKILI